MVVCSKSCKVLARSMIFCAFSRIELLFASFCSKVHRNTKTWYFVRKSCIVFAKSMSFRAFFPNKAVFATFCNKVQRNVKTWYFFRKVASFGEIDDFSCFLTKWGTFCNFFLKSSWKCQDIVVCTKSWQFWPNRWFLLFLHEMKDFLQLFSEKLIEMQRDGSLLEKLQSFGQIDDFSRFFTKWGTFCNFFLKSWSKCKDVVVCSKSCKVLAKLMIFRAFSGINPLSATFCWKVHRNTKTW